jgi:hypothetical protein
MAQNNGFVYAYNGPPFNWQGNFCTSQWNVFTAWVNARTGNMPAIQQFYQIRAAQLRKTSGVLEQFYISVNDEALAPTFNKQPWKPGPQGHFNYPYRDDHLSSIAVGQIKSYMKEQFQRQDEGVWAMNQMRNLIEKTEDNAERAYLALNPTQWTNETISTLIQRINGYFGSPDFEAPLLMDQTNVYPTGTTQPKFRVHQLDIPTQWEIEVNTMATPGTGNTVNLKEIGS